MCGSVWGGEGGGGAWRKTFQSKVGADFCPSIAGARLPADRLHQKAVQPNYFIWIFYLIVSIGFILSIGFNQLVACMPSAVVVSTDASSCCPVTMMHDAM